MIRDTRPQNAIVLIMIIAGLVGAGNLYHTASYYGGSYVIIRYLEVDFVDLTISNLDPENQTVNPTLAVTVAIVAPEGLLGDATLTNLKAVIFLNNESLAYQPFQLSVPAEHRKIEAGYNQTFTISSTIASEFDKGVIFDAYETEQWQFGIVLTISYRVFDARLESFRTVAFAHEGYTPG